MIDRPLKGAAFGYVRISKSDRADPSLSPEAQTLVIRRYCDEHRLELKEVFQDENTSGGQEIARRPAGQHLVRQLAHYTAKGCHVVVARADRAWRSVRDGLATIQAWEKAGIHVHILNLPIPDLNTPMGKLMVTIMLAVAEWERGEIRSRTAASLQHRKGKLLKYTKVCPHGYRVVPPGALLPEHEDMLTVFLIDKWANEGRISTHKIAARLTELDRPLPPGTSELPPGRRLPSMLGRSWNQKTVHSLGKRVASDTQYRTECMREVVSARSRGWLEPDPLLGSERAALAAGETA